MWLSFIVVNWFARVTVEKKEEKRKVREERKMGGVQCGVCRTAVFHLDSDSVKTKKNLTHLFPYSVYLPLDVPACPVSLLAGSGNFHGNTKKACTDQSLFVWRPFVQSVNTMLYTVTGWLPQESFHFAGFHFALNGGRVQLRGRSRTDRPGPLHLDAAWQITLHSAFLSHISKVNTHYSVVIILCGICLQTHKLSKLQLHRLVVQVTVYNFHNQPCAVTETVWLNKPNRTQAKTEMCTEEKFNKWGYFCGGEKKVKAQAIFLNLQHHIHNGSN